MKQEGATYTDQYILPKSLVFHLDAKKLLRSSYDTA